MQTTPTTNCNDTRQQPLVSFVITDYNLPADLLRECVQSILALSLRQEEREIILVDDGSDASPIDELSDLRQHIMYIKQYNRGPSAARNTGIRMATGKYIQFVDGDDFLLLASYEHCLDIARYHNPDMVLFRATDKASVETPLELGDPMTGSQYMRNNNVRASACGYIFKLSTLGQLRFPEDIPTHEDEDFTPQLLLRAEKVYSTDANAYFYRKREGSITNSLDAKSAEQDLHYLETVIYHLQSIIDTLPDTDKQSMNRRIAQLTMDYIYNAMRLTRDSKTVDAALERLEAHGLFPLPDKKYTRKYSLFRKVVSDKRLRGILLTLIPK